MNETIYQWHQFAASPKSEILDAILAENVQFHSPFVWKSKGGKVITTTILMIVTEIFENFRYVREIYGANDFCLEFEANIGELTLRGVDLIKIDDDGKIVDFEVMIRPANALQKLGEKVGAKLAEKGFI
jgi:hypothetical protein